MHHPPAIPRGGMLCTMYLYTNPQSSVPHICSEMYCEVIRTPHKVSQSMACGVCTHAVSCDGWSEHHTANGCAHTGNQSIPSFGVRISLLISNSVKEGLLYEDVKQCVVTLWNRGGHVVFIDRWVLYTVPSIDRFYSMLHFIVQTDEHEASSIPVMGWTR